MNTKNNKQTTNDLTETNQGSGSELDTASCSLSFKDNVRLAVKRLEVVENLTNPIPEETLFNGSDESNKLRTDASYELEKVGEWMDEHTKNLAAKEGMTVDEFTATYSSRSLAT
jgi:hypothetical protein